MTYRAKNGRFVKASNPLAVIGRLNASLAAQRAADEAASMAGRRARVPNGIVTREDLAALAIAATAGE